MTFASSASRIGDSNFGTVVSGLGNLNPICVQINPLSTETFEYGLPVKIISGTVHPVVELATAATDPIFGIIQYNAYSPQTQLTVGKEINIIPMGLQSVVMLKAGAAITAGKAVEYDPTNKAFITSTAVTNTVGVCLNSATALGDYIKVMLTVPNISNTNHL